MISGAQIPLLSLVNLRELEVSCTTLEDKHLEGLENLKLCSLILEATNITQTTILRLSDMISLRCLNLNRCNDLKPGFLKYLQKLFYLEEIYLNSVQIEEEEIKYLNPFIRKLAAHSGKILKKNYNRIEPVDVKPIPTESSIDELCLIS